MNKRRFLSTMGAAVAALFVPNRTEPPILTSGFVSTDFYARVHPKNVADIQLLRGEIGRYEGVRFIETPRGGIVHSSVFDELRARPY